MCRNLLVWPPLLAALSLLSIGCRSAASPPQPAATSASSAPALRPRATEAAHPATVAAENLQGITDAALADDYRAALADPTNESLALKVSRELLEHQQPDKAAKLLTQAAHNPGASARIFVQLGYADLLLHRTQAAIHASQQAIATSPANLAGYQNLYLSYLQNQQANAARQALTQAEMQPPTNADFLIGLAGLYANYAQQFPAQQPMARRRQQQALEQAAKLEPKDVRAQLRLAEGFERVGQTRRAVAFYQKALRQSSSKPLLAELVHGKLAELYLRAHDRTNAQSQLQAIVRADPNNGLAYYYLGGLAYDANDWPRAVTDYQQALLCTPKLERAYYDLAAAQIAGGRPDDALATLETASEKFPQSFLQEYLTAAAEEAQKRYAAAVPHFRAAEALARAHDPKRLTDTFYFQAGAALERTGHYSQAADCFRHALQLNPHFAAALNYLGYMWADHGQKLHQARRLIRKALQLDPKNPAYLDSMGWVLFKLKRPQAALGYLLQATALLPQPDATIYDHLGDIYAALDKKDQARAAWKVSLSVEANPQVRKKFHALGQ